MIAQNDNVLLHPAARFCLLSACAVVFLAACTEKPLLTMEEKTRFARELIDDRAECNDHRQHLSRPAVDDTALAALYESARAAHCLKPDV